MKKIKLLFSALLMLASSFAFAQTEQEMFMSVFKMEKRAYFSQNMKLTEIQFNSFWNIYSEFEKEREVLAKDRIAMLNDYVIKYPTMTDADADVIMKKWLALDKKEDAIRLTYYNKMKKELGAKIAGQFVQLDEYISTAIKFEVLDELPFIGELNVQ
jgi:hypothetical protein